jgi:hypothetical protein
MYPNLDFWFENKPSGNPVLAQIVGENIRVLCSNYCFDFEKKANFSQKIGK